MGIRRWIAKTNHVFRFFYPKRKLRDQIPLGPRRYSGDQHPYEGDFDKTAARFLQYAGVAKTEADAIRLLHKHKGARPHEIARIEQRQRRFWGRSKRAWKRFKRIW